MDRGCGVRIYIVEEKPLAFGGESAVYEWQEHNSNSYVLLSVEFSLYVSPVVTTEKQSNLCKNFTLVHCSGIFMDNK